MKEGLEADKPGFMKERLDLTNTGFMKEGLDPNQHRIYEERTRS